MYPRFTHAESERGGGQAECNGLFSPSQTVLVRKAQGTGILINVIDFVNEEIDIINEERHEWVV
jgi:hypothetical protein